MVTPQIMNNPSLRDMVSNFVTEVIDKAKKEAIAKTAEKNKPNQQNHPVIIFVLFSQSPYWSNHKYILIDLYSMLFIWNTDENLLLGPI